MLQDDPDKKIQAGFAQNTGNLLAQYRSLTANYQATDKYDATLTICALQSLLTICSELMDAMKVNQKGVWDEIIPDIPHQWGIKRSFIVTNTFSSDLTYGKFLEHLRNALCHPTSPDKAPKHPSTGYTTVPDGSGVISRFRFTDSPWIDRGGVHSKASSTNKVAVGKTVESFLYNNPAVKLEVKSILQKNKRKERFEVFQGNQPYLPIFVAELPLSELVELTIQLANRLAQPIVDNYDGISIQPLVRLYA